MKIFTDGSVQPATGIGCGAYLLVFDAGESLERLKSRIRTKQFMNTSSTRLELQTFLWALGLLCDDNTSMPASLECYTDCQTLVGLAARRKKLEANNYISKNGKRLNNADLYQQFYALIDELKSKHIHCQLLKLEGHKASKNKTSTDHLFALVDKAARNAVRQLGI